MVWRGILLTAHTDVVVLNNGNPNPGRYILDILEEYIVPHASYIGPILFTNTRSTKHISFDPKLFYFLWN